MPVPAGVEHAGAALRRRIRWLDEQAVVGTVKFGTRRRFDAGTTGTNRWRMRVDLRQPVPGDGRATTVSGVSSFHLEVTSLPKSAATTSSAAEGGRNVAAAHENYLSDGRDSTATRASGFERYLGDTRDRADEVVDAPDESRVSLILSNIGDTLAARTAFWEQAWAVERTPSTMRLEVCPDRDDTFDLNSIIDDQQAPSAFREACRILQDDRATSPRGAKGKKVLHVELTDERDIAWALNNQQRFRARRSPIDEQVGAKGRQGHGTAGSAGHDNKSRRAIHLVKPRAGEVQMRLVAELPHELGLEQQHAVAKRFYARMQAIGIPVTLVVHQPDGRNDRRGCHLHFIAYRRRCDRYEDDCVEKLGNRHLCVLQEPL